MKFLFTIVVPSLWLSLFTGCTTPSEISVPEISSDSPANPQSSIGSRTTALPHLGEDAITRATSSRLKGETSAASEMSIDHGSMKMNDGDMKMDHSGMKMKDGVMKMDHSKMNMEPENTTPSPDSPAVESYTCPMHPEIHKPVPGKCPICGMKLMKEKSAAHSH